MEQVEPLHTEGMTEKKINNNITYKQMIHCQYCENRLIDVESQPIDKLALVTDEGRYKCGTCVQEELDNDFMEVAPYSDVKRYNEIKERRAYKQKKKDELDQIYRLVDAINKATNKHKWKVVK
jgi:hypothetical protein